VREQGASPLPNNRMHLTPSPHRGIFSHL
jgi:hypothetical protein